VEEEEEEEEEIRAALSTVPDDAPETGIGYFQFDGDDGYLGRCSDGGHPACDTSQSTPSCRKQSPSFVTQPYATTAHRLKRVLSAALPVETETAIGPYARCSSEHNHAIGEFRPHPFPYVVSATVSLA